MQTMISSQITWSANLLHPFQEEIENQWTCHWAKHHSHREFMVMDKLIEIFHSSTENLRVAMEISIIFSKFQVPPTSAEKLIWPNCKKEKGVGKGNNNCYSYQCLWHLDSGATPNNFASSGSRCLPQLLCTVLTAPVNSMLFLWLRVAVIWVYECEICLSLLPMSDWG